MAKDFGTNTVLYTKPGCGWCQKAKQLLQSKGVQFSEITVDGNTVTKESMNADLGRTDLNTVPQVVLNGTFIPGGYTGLAKHYERN